MTRTTLSDSELAALAARIQQNYNYDDRSGLLVNRKTGRAVKGKKVTGREYMAFRIRFLGRWMEVYMHRAVWAWHNGHFPTMQLDHIDLDPTNNKIDNLREVTQSENMRNRVYPWKPNAKSGLPGVYKYRNSSRIVVANHPYHFRDKYEAFYHLTLLGRRFKLEVRGEK